MHEQAYGKMAILIGLIVYASLAASRRMVLRSK